MSNFEENKKFLKRYKPYLKQINRLEDRLYELDDRIESTRSPRISGMPGGGIPRTLTDELVERNELESRINDLIKESKVIKTEIIFALDHLENPNEANVLEMYFIRDIDLEAVAETLHYSTRQVNRLYSQGVVNIMAPL